MTIWRPDLSNLKGPDYQRLTDAIRRDIEAGRLQPGDRLPPQRDLADTLAMTLGTVTRAYQAAAKRGLVAGEVGRGTYVLVPPGAEDGEGLLDLSLNAIAPHGAARIPAARWSRRTPRGGRGMDCASQRARLTLAGADHSRCAARPAHRAERGDVTGRCHPRRGAHLHRRDHRGAHAGAEARTRCDRRRRPAS